MPDFLRKEFAGLMKRHYVDFNQVVEHVIIVNIGHLIEILN